MENLRLPTMIIVDDHLIFQQGLKAVITAEKIADVIGVASNGNDFINLLSEMKPDIVLLDINMPFMNGEEATSKALALIPDLKIIVLTMYGDEEYYYKMINTGVKGFVLKTSGIIELEKAVNEVMAGESYFSNEILRNIIRNIGLKNSKPKFVNNYHLTDREIEILKEICQGLSSDEIAERLNISSKTVKSHKANLMEKTGCKNIQGLILYAIKNKIVEI